MRRLFSRLFDRSEPGGPSIYEHVRSHVNPNGPGLLDGGAELPDEVHGSGVIRWAPGALDGVAGHHMGVDSDEQAVDRVVQLLIKDVRDGRAPRADLDRALAEVEVLAVVDQILPRLSDAGLTVGEAEALGRRMATKAAARNTVKLGIALLGAVPGTQNREIFLILGRHDEFTLYTAVALSNSEPEPDQALWELAKQVTGWGRIHIVERLKDTPDPAIRDWILRTGFHNDVMDEYLVYIAATTGDLVHALEGSDPDDELLDATCDIITSLISGGPAEGIADYEDAPRAIELLLGHLDRRATSVHHYLGVFDIEMFLADDERWSEPDAPVWPPGIRDSALTTARQILARPLWNERVAEGLGSADRAEFYEAERAAGTLGIDTLEASLDRVAKYPADGDWYFVMRAVDEQRLERVLDAARQSIPLDAIATGPGTEMGLGPEFTHHNDAEWIVRDLARFPGHGWDFIAAALKSPVIRGRHMALGALEAWPRSAWPAEAEAAVAAGLPIEPDPEVRERMDNLLASRSAGMNGAGDGPAP